MGINGELPTVAEFVVNLLFPSVSTYLRESPFTRHRLSKQSIAQVFLTLQATRKPAFNKGLMWYAKKTASRLIAVLLVLSKILSVFRSMCYIFKNIEILVNFA